MQSVLKCAVLLLLFYFQNTKTETRFSSKFLVAIVVLVLVHMQGFLCRRHGSGVPAPIRSWVTAASSLLRSEPFDALLFF